LPSNFPTGEAYAPAYVMRKLAFQPSDVEQSGGMSRRSSLRRHATPDFLLASPADRPGRVYFPHRGSTCAISSPSPDLPSFHYSGPHWQRAESSVDSAEDYEDNNSSLDHINSTGEEYDGIDMDDSSLPSTSVLGGGLPIGPSMNTKASPQLSFMRRGSQDSLTSGLRVNRPTPATPRIVHHPHSLPPLGFTPAAPTGDPSSVFLGSAKHGRPFEAMCVDPFERKKRKVGGAPGPDLSRFRTEFTEIELIGKGSFSDVFRARNRLDGQFYAIKRLKRQCSGDIDKSVCEREASILAMLAQCSDEDPMLACHIIRYFASWFEDGRLYIQIEYCQSNLSDYIISGRGGLPRSPVPSAIVATVVRDVSLGLKFLHSMDLVHLDVKPANIFLSSANLYKLGDLGLVSPAGEPAEVTSGDARYMPREILLNNYRHLKKADIFSLGATALECMLGERLEAEGEEWHKLRDGFLPVDELRQFPPPLVELVARMLSSDPEIRPTCEEILQNAIVMELAQPRKLRSSVFVNMEDVSPTSDSTRKSRPSPGKVIMRTLRRMFTTS
jgi:serine/threonine protein kinase